MTAPELRVVRYDAQRYDAYATFANACWGRGCYQASPRYLSWLLSAPRDPAAHPDDVLLAMAGERVVGCIQRLRVPWRTEQGEMETVTALHNWAVDEAYRKGVGLLLLTRAMRGDPHAFISSAVGELGLVYRKLRCQEVQASWYRKVLRPIRGGLRLAVARVSGVVRDASTIRLQFAKASRAAGWRGTLEPTPGDVALMVNGTADQAASTRPAWSEDSFRWRFLHPDGPLHAFAFPSDHEFMALAFELRMGLAIARIIEMQIEASAARRTVRTLWKVLRRSGVDVLLTYSADPRVNEALHASGWRPRAKAQPSFFHHARGKAPFAKLAFNGSGADFGFETMRPRLRRRGSADANV